MRFFSQGRANSSDALARERQNQAPRSRTASTGAALANGKHRRCARTQENSGAADGQRKRVRRRKIRAAFRHKAFHPRTQAAEAGEHSGSLDGMLFAALFARSAAARVIPENAASAQPHAYAPRRPCRPHGRSSEGRSSRPRRRKAACKSPRRVPRRAPERSRPDRAFPARP